MKLSAMIRRFRLGSGDKEKPFQWTDADIAEWISEAERQACIRGRLIREDDNDPVCVIDLYPGERSYPLHSKIYEIISLFIKDASGASRPVFIKSREWLDANHSGWRESTDPAWAVIQNDKSIRVVGAISAGDQLYIDCFRLPLREMKNGDDCPEIHEAHHDHLVDWALHKAFQEQDANWFDANRSAIHEAKFTNYFGLLPDSDLRRSTREDDTQHNEAFFF